MPALMSLTAQPDNVGRNARAHVRCHHVQAPSANLLIMPAAGEENFHRGHVLTAKTRDASMASSIPCMRASSRICARAAGAPVDHVDDHRPVFLVSAQRSVFFSRRMTLVRNRAERSCATTRTKNVAPSADRMCGSLSPSRWTPQLTSSTSRPIGNEALWLRECSRRWCGCPCHPFRLQLGSKKRTM